LSIQYAILGFLSWRSLSGYDIKKLIEESPILYWSGSNNQIYRTLVELHNEGLVTCEVQPQEHLPTRKVYTISEKGRSALRAWLLSSPELPLLRNAFLVQLTWADALTSAELDGLLARYEHEVEMQWLMCRERTRRDEGSTPRTPREAYVWQAIAEHHCDFYAQEVAWVRKVRAELAGEHDKEDHDARGGDLSVGRG
jgi:PadR family transcriptional regulator AphA